MLNQLMVDLFAAVHVCMSYQSMHSVTYQRSLITS